MALSTPTANRWPSDTIYIEDETHPLLFAPPQTISKLPASSVISKKTHHETFQLDHGHMAWLQVFCGWILSMNSWGLLYSFGAFQTFYINELIPDHTASSVAWIGSIQLFLTTLGCLFGGIYLDRGYLQSLIAIGTCLEVIGLLAITFSTQYWQLMLAQGVCVGIGSGILGLLPVAIISMYFDKKRMLAVGIASAGASFAAVLYPLVLRYLFSRTGFPSAVRILILLILIANAFPFIHMRLQPKGGNHNSKFTLDHFEDPIYSLRIASFTLFMASVVAPYFFLQEYTLRFGVTESTAFKILAIMNTANMYGRILPNFWVWDFADRYSVPKLIMPLSLICIFMLFLLPFLHTLAAFITFSVIYGFVSGALMILPPPIIALMTPNTAYLGVRMGLAYFCTAFAGLIGNLVTAVVNNDGNVADMRGFRFVWWGAALMMGAGMAILVEEA